MGNLVVNNPMNPVGENFWEIFDNISRDESTTNYANVDNDINWDEEEDRLDEVDLNKSTNVDNKERLTAREVVITMLASLVLGALAGGICTALSIPFTVGMIGGSLVGLACYVYQLYQKYSEEAPGDEITPF